ncbi:hypothetical protein RhiirA1_454916 [Rhizophagus irregularis]|uniref:Uncharacterized protein n=1 Tax=Rhizophagus irregularis TaxID=588596 RepID=A0A2N0S429_9GLOM|nr:hypothetical protein RhiirA1_454916 [Rhizophagus irregularis]
MGECQAERLVIYIDPQKAQDLDWDLTLQKFYYRSKGYYQTAEKMQTDYDKTLKDYQVSGKPKFAELYCKIADVVNKRKCIHILVKLPYRDLSKWPERPDIFRYDKKGNLIVIVDDRNVKQVFGEQLANVIMAGVIKKVSKIEKDYVGGYFISEIRYIAKRNQIMFALNDLYSTLP